MVKTSELIKALQEHMERNGDLNVSIEVRDSNMNRLRYQQERALLNPDHWGNIVTHAHACVIQAKLEAGCKITTSKELKEHRDKYAHWREEE